VSTNNNGSITLSRNGSDDAGLAPSVLELGNLGTLGSTSRDDRLNLLEQPVRRLFTICGLVVSVVEAREGSQSASEVGLAQLGEQSLDSRSLSNGTGEARKELETVARLVEISDVDEVLVFLCVLNMVLWMRKLATNSC